MLCWLTCGVQTNLHKASMQPIFYCIREGSRLFESCLLQCGPYRILVAPPNMHSRCVIMSTFLLFYTRYILDFGEYVVLRSSSYLHCSHAVVQTTSSCVGLCMTLSCAMQAYLSKLVDLIAQLVSLEGACASTGLSLLCVHVGYKQLGNDRPLCA